PREGDDAWAAFTGDPRWRDDPAEGRGPQPAPPGWSAEPGPDMPGAEAAYDDAPEPRSSRSVFDDGPMPPRASAPMDEPVDGAPGPVRPPYDDDYAADGYEADPYADDAYGDEAYGDGYATAYEDTYGDEPYGDEGAGFPGEAARGAAPVRPARRGAKRSP